MIAVFAESEKSFRIEMDVNPKSEFKLIHSPDDICGRKFTGIILCYGYYENRRVCDALDVLRTRQPELFAK